MSATATSTPPPAAPKVSGGKGGRVRLSFPVILLIIAGALLALSAVRVITGAEDITSSGQISTALAMAVPIGLAGLGGLWAERAGVVNIGLEGMMILGTFFGAWAGWQTNPWIGVLAGVLGGMLGGLLHAVATVTFGVDHIISGIAINILALGFTTYLAKLWFNTGEALEKGGSPKQSPPADSIADITVPGLSDGLKSIEDHGWFFVSDLAGILAGLVTDVSLLTIVAVLLFVGTFVVLWKSAFGLRLRSCGENPIAAESLGVNVYKYKYIAVIVSGGMAGLGGAFLSLVTSHIYNEGQTGGRGYIGLAAMIFGNWRPGGLAMGAGLFGYADALQLRNGGESVHALLLLLVVVLIVLAVWKLYRKSYLQGAISGVIGLAVLAWYLGTDVVPTEFVAATPYVVTLLVLSLSAQRLRMPKADGMRYRKGQGK
ncbi:ABC transporter permease [Streptomyces clavuligerus]|uniref:Sugar ABC transporter integral membrane protein n=1 Tax=Streptomyces clavuligerus TaxID=1901 RepID=B5GT05_STRCL|nr:ABC transporter permease [Streptomyces clavuligerus]ANW18492.1 ABC transporter permease [Streptomyces clavuligerus]AXU13048.1 ABC transporter permease [Streptomyces clavuligerus]EDY49451.1 sugar ABC transporter integral membrane protein [Streptomyces clavuligerus]EFG08867.1 sugar ABC transporter integral membrane protein [Streptomyces clavuligerus]MBY6302984.1 ABC transporter permease [Streptomyces clavuligerus]